MDASFECAPSNKSLDASGGSVFLNEVGPAEVPLNRAAASTQSLGAYAWHSFRLLLMKYEVWKYVDEYTESCFPMPVNHQYEAFLRYREAYEPDSELVCSFEADSIWEAHARYDEFMGYEPDDAMGAE